MPTNIVMVDVSARRAQVTFNPSNAVSDNRETSVLIQWLIASANPLVHVVSLVRSVAVAGLCVIEASLMFLWIHWWTSRTIEVEMQV